MLRVTRRHSYALLGTQNLAFIDQVFFALNGTIWVDRRDKADMAATKNGILAYLQKGQSVLWFPEGTWNLTASQLMMPMKWGIIDIAKSCDAQIIPAALDYDWEKMVCSVKFGKPMHGTDFDNKAEAIRDLRDTMATMRWEFMSTQPVLNRGGTTLRYCGKKCIELSTSIHHWIGSTNAPAFTGQTRRRRKCLPIWNNFSQNGRMRFCFAKTEAVGGGMI